MKSLKKKKGFTLIELIIVIAIIGILAAIAVPKFGDIQADSKKKADVATAKIIADAASMLIAQGGTNGLSVSSFSSGEYYPLGNAKCSNLVGSLQGSVPPVPKTASYNHFTINVDANGNVKVYASTQAAATLTELSSVDSDDQLYPTTGDNFK